MMVAWLVAHLIYGRRGLRLFCLKSHESSNGGAKSVGLGVEKVSCDSSVLIWRLVMKRRHKFRELGDRDTLRTSRRRSDGKRWLSHLLHARRFSWGHIEIYGCSCQGFWTPALTKLGPLPVQYVRLVLPRHVGVTGKAQMTSINGRYSHHAAHGATGDGLSPAWDACKPLTLTPETCIPAISMGTVKLLPPCGVGMHAVSRSKTKEGKKNCPQDDPLSRQLLHRYEYSRGATDQSQFETYTVEYGIVDNAGMFRRNNPFLLC